ncbi:hypothetical protein CsSME_00029705 [Camellia sinensis var. sinensis]
MQISPANFIRYCPFIYIFYVHSRIGLTQIIFSSLLLNQIFFFFFRFDLEILIAGLQRCGKSCRLRWINYLRPDLKRGTFTEQEERIIIDVHRILGNRWAQIAKHLPGRTDNEVKNFWNSCIKKKLIAQGLDPNTHNLLSSSNRTANKVLPHTHHQQNTSVFSITTSQTNDMQTPLVTLVPPSDTNSINHIPISLHEYQSPSFAPTTRNQSGHSLMEFANSTDHLSHTFLMLSRQYGTKGCPGSETDGPMPFGTRSSMETTTVPSSSMNNLYGFGFIDENSMWGSDLEHFDPTRGEMVMQLQEQQHPQQEKGCEGEADKVNESISSGQNMGTSLMESSNFDFEFVESALLPCGMYCNVNPMDPLAWDC